MITALRSVGRGKRRALAKRTSYSLVIEVLAMATAMATFLVLGRSLGPTDYGRYSATLSMFTVLGPFAAGGAAHLATKRVALGTSPNTVWPAAAGMIYVGGSLAAVAAIGLAVFLLPGIPLLVVFGLAVAELALLRVVPTAVLMMNGLDRPDIGAFVMLLTLVLRLAALGAFFTLDASDLSTWVVLHLISAAASVAMCNAVTANRFGVRDRFTRPTATEYREGFPFALVLAPNSIMNDADKTLLTSLGRPTDGGLYAAGYRIASMAYTPIMAIIRATYGDFFRQGAKGMGAAMRTAQRLTWVTTGVGLLAAAGLVVVSPLLPILLGDDFGDSVQVVRWMAVLPVLKGLEYPAANALTGSNRQYLRVALLAGVAAINVVLNLVLIPDYGWRGAAVATYIAEGMFIVALWASLVYLSRQERRRAERQGAHA